MKLKLIGIALWATALALAQDRPPAQDTKAKDQPDQNAQEQEQTYAGPSILSRDKSLIGERGGKLIDFRFYGELTGVYDSGLTALVVDRKGMYRITDLKASRRALA